MSAGRISSVVAALAVLATTMTAASAAAHERRPTAQEDGPAAPEERADAPPEGAVLFFPQWPGNGVAFWNGQRGERPVDTVQQALVGNFDGDGMEEVFGYTHWRDDQVWALPFFHDTAEGPIFDVYLTASLVSGDYIPLVGDFGGPTGPGGRSIDDILWYAPGPARDTLWIFPPEGGALKYHPQINGDYRPFVLEGGGSEPEAIVWYAPGPAPDAIWDFRDVPYGARRSRSIRIDGDYQPTSFATDDARLVHWYDADGFDSTWRFESTGPTDVRFRTLASTPQVDGDRQPIALDRGATAGVFLHAPSTPQDVYVGATDASGTAMTATSTVQVWGRYQHVVAGDVTSSTPGQRDGVDELIFGGGARAVMWRMPTVETRVETVYSGGLPRKTLPVVVATELPE